MIRIAYRGIVKSSYPGWPHDAETLRRAITGHAQATVLTIIERYMVRTAKMARLAFGKRMAAEGIEPAIGAESVKGAG